jgi:hypothetical protein
MVRALAAAGCVIALTACGSSVAVPVASQTPSNSAAESPAATLRVHLDVLLGEHVFAIAKLALAATAGRQDEFHSYAALLATSGGDTEALFRTAIGETAGGQFGDAWTELNNDLVDYLVAAATHDDQASASAAAALNQAAGDHTASVLASSLSLPNDAMSRLATNHATALKAIVDDVVAANYPQLFTDIAAARTQAVTFGDTIALQVAHVFADRFPGDGNASAAVRRVNLNSLLQQQGYLMTVGTDATVAGVDGEAAAASASLATSADQLAGLYGGTLWKNELPLVSSYAKGGDAGVRQNVIGAAPAGLTAAFTALLQVVDDQRNKQFGSVATDDRAMAAAFATVADEVSLSSPS